MNAPAVTIPASLVQLHVQTLSVRTTALVKVDTWEMGRQAAYRLVSGSLQISL